jgi:hypothetical protein
MVRKFKGRDMNTYAVWVPFHVLFAIANADKFSGLRIYLAIYHNNKHQKIGRNTIVLTAVDDKMKDIDACLTKAELKDLFNNNKETRFKKFMTDPKKLAKMLGDPQNNGSLCPHNCD